MIQYPIYSGGKFITTDEKLIVTNPYDNSVIAETFRADQNILDESIIAAQSVEKKMA
jgi:acyl-CoA reductase-like NAD-dependent aldehyde dehydrogenase